MVNARSHISSSQPQSPAKCPAFLEVGVEDMDVEEEQLQQRVNTHAAGSLSKAAKKLVSSGIHSDCPIVAEKLRALCPQASLPPSLPEPPAGVPRFDGEQGKVRSALRSFSTATAPGPTGLRVDHLQECNDAPPSAAGSGTARSPVNRRLSALLRTRSRPLVQGCTPRTLLHPRGPCA